MSASLEARTLRVAAGGPAAPELLRPDTGGAHLVSRYLEAHAAQLCGFVLIGAGVAALNVALLYGLRSALRLPDALAVTLMYACGTLVHFRAHRRLNYRAHNRPLHPQVGSYTLMLAWNLIVMQAMVGLASRLSWSPYLAVLLASGATMISTFLLLTHVVFAGRQHPRTRQP